MDIEERNQLIVKHAPLVKRIAGRCALTLANFVEQDELESYGIFGLIDAIDKYNPNIDCSFETYASIRIRGAILDNIRKNDFLTRATRDKQKRYAQYKKTAADKYLREPTRNEILEESGLSEEEFQKLEMTVDNALTSLEAHQEKEGSVEPQNGVAMGQFESPEANIEKEDLKNALSKALLTLTDREREIIQLVFYEGMTRNEVGATLNISLSRVSQIISKATNKMRRSMGEYEDYLYIW